MPVGRRERNKEEKRERILAAATKLFATQGVDDVTTQQIADAADIGSGTLFLYAKTKGELLLMVQNAHYSEALAKGVVAADRCAEPLDALMAIVSQIVACNRAHVSNGRTYLREMVFGDPTEPHHSKALEIVADTEAEQARILMRTTQCEPELAISVSRAVSALLLRCLALAPPAGDVADIVAAVRSEASPLVAMLAKKR